MRIAEAMDQDRCTGWPDGWPTWLGGIGSEWRHCCKAHDDFYAAQTSLDLFAYLGAHYDLAVCVAEVGVGMAVAMFLGLAVFGLPLVIDRHNKHGRPKR